MTPLWLELQLLNKLRLLKKAGVVIASSALFLLALWHFIDIKPASLSWWKWVEHAVYRYQTLITGLLATWFVAQQLRTQRKHHRLERAFTVRKEMAAANELQRIGFTISEHLRTPGDLIVADIDQSLAVYRDQYNPAILSILEDLRQLAKRYNKLAVLSGNATEDQKASLDVVVELIQKSIHRLTNHAYGMHIDAEDMVMSD
ncbi:hypothetical protein LJR231_001795 [Phyllobacterium sp. LjRoot231]|uniref:hypothetical protein n=1 Tax=Phyllobacterium sp. LjRoot231 TaxID=3342289 RepID=UPI003ECF22E2